MRGTILKLDENGGIISADDGSRYVFALDQWMDVSAPDSSHAVDFTPDGNKAEQIYMVASTRAARTNLSGALNPLRKLYKFIGITMIVAGAVMTLTVLFAFIGIPLIILGLFLVFIAPKFVSGVENIGTDVIKRTRRD